MQPRLVQCLISKTLAARMSTLALCTFLTMMPMLAHADEATLLEQFNTEYTGYRQAQEAGDNRTALGFAREVVRLGSQLFGEDDPRRPVLHLNYARLLTTPGPGWLTAKKRTSKMAQEQLDIALPMVEDLYGKKSVEIIPYLEQLANAQYGSSDARRQHKIFKRALKITKSHFGENTAEHTALLFRAGSTMFFRSNSTLGKGMIEEAQRYYLAQGDASRIEVGMTWYLLGRMAKNDNNDNKAITYLTNSLRYFDDDTDISRNQRLYTHSMLVGIYESQNKSDLATQHCRAIGLESPPSLNSEPEPIYRRWPQYPRDMLVRRFQADIDVVFTIDENGFVRDARVVNTQVQGPDANSSALGAQGRTRNEQAFNIAALKSIERSRYAPRFVDGVAVATEEQKGRVSFKLEKHDNPYSY